MCRSSKNLNSSDPKIIYIKGINDRLYYFDYFFNLNLAFNNTRWF